MNQILRVAHREVSTRIRSRGFKFITALMLLIMVASPILVSLLPDQSLEQRQVTIGLTGDTSAQLPAILEAFGSNRFAFDFEDVDHLTAPELDEVLLDGEVDLVLESHSTLAWPEYEDFELARLIQAALQQDQIMSNASEMGLSEDDLGRLLAPIETRSRLATGDRNVEGLRQGIAMFGLLLIFVFPQAFGQLTMLGVVEEKSTRVVEVLLGHMRPKSLLFGKVIGLCVLSLAQIIPIIIALIVTLRLFDLVEVPASVWRFVPMLAVCVVAALVIYTTLFALLGSLISRQEDSAQVMLPAFVPMFAAYIVGANAAFGQADTALIKVLTWVPFTAPTMLVVRVARGTISATETAISLGILIISAWLLIRLAARVYEFALLRTGSRVGWKEAISLSREARAT